MKISTHASNERTIKCCWIWKYPPQHQMKNIHFCIRWNIRSCCIRYGYLLPDMKISTPVSDEKYPPLHQMKISSPAPDENIHSASDENIHSCIRWKISTPASDEISSPGASDNWFGREPETDNWLSFTAGQEEPFVPTTTKHQKHWRWWFDENLQDKLFQGLLILIKCERCIRMQLGGRNMR